MNDLVIQPVNSRRRRKQFLQLPWKLYADDPNWIPPLRLNQKELVNYKPHPFYNDAEIQTFLALNGGEPCGRVAAIVNHAHNRRHKEQLGFFGFFESVNDAEVAAGLFEAARAWLGERRIHQLRGPTNPSMNYECGLLVDGFDSPPFFMMTYNPPYYAELIEGCGFQKTQDMYAYWGHSNMLGTLDEKLARMVEAATERFGITVRKMDASRFLDEVNLFLDIYNQSLVGTWGFVPLSDAEIRHMAASLKYLIEPRLALTAEIDGRPVGATFCLLDYNPRIKAIDGRLFPLGFLKLIRRKHEIKNMRVLSANVVPEYQSWGIGLVVLNGLVPLVNEWNIEEVEFSWVLESNHLSRASLERGGAKRHKTYRLYDSATPPPE